MIAPTGAAIGAVRALTVPAIAPELNKQKYGGFKEKALILVKINVSED